MQRLFALCALALLAACTGPQSPSDGYNIITAGDRQHQVVKELLEKMYRNDRTQQNPLSDTSVFSKAIAALNGKCNLVTQRDRDRIAQSEYPTDKPLLREGSAVAGLYEGASDFVIRKITMSTGQAEILVDAFNKEAEPTIHWTDTVELISENGWKVDNIFFDKNVHTGNTPRPNLKDELTSFSGQLLP